MSDFFRNVKFFIPNLIYWLPILWRDRDWDYAFLLRILTHKLDGMSKHIREYGMREDAEEIADQIASVSTYLQVVNDGLLSGAVYREHERKWGEAELELWDTENSEFKELLVHYENAPTIELEEQAHKELVEAYQAGEDREHRILVDTLTRMGEQLERWWD